MEINPPLPLASKACSRCRARKVKCDLTTPRCAACTRLDDVCNITDYVTYSYQEVQNLRDVVAQLREQLESVTRAKAPLPLAHTAQQPHPLPTASSSQQPWQAVSSQDGRNAWAGDIQREAEEVGVLAIGGPDVYSQNKYVGSATGSTFARIFFKQLGLDPLPESHNPFNSPTLGPLQVHAALPPQSVARSLLHFYIARVHTWWPLVQLPHIRSLCQRMYQRPKECSDQEKFLFFIMMALASNEQVENGGKPATIDLNSPEAYFQTALWFFHHFQQHLRDLFGIQTVLLLAIWMLNSSSSSHSNDLWHMSRYAMSAAIEAGLHRHNSDWGFSREELEIRNRTWWCAFNLERQVATMTGRVLSIREHAIHAPLPTTSTMDNLTADEARAAPAFFRHKVELFNRMIALRRIGGRILESIYIARGPDGRCTDNFQQICARADEARQALRQWKTGLSALGLKPSREYSETKIEYCLLQLLLHRPSPTFMVPTRQMLSVCSDAASSALHRWGQMQIELGISSVCRCFRQLHDILVTGLAALYCDWRTAALTAAASGGAPTQISPPPPNSYRHETDTSLCLNLMSQGIAHMKNKNLLRYRDLFRAVRHKVYTTTTDVNTNNNNVVQGEVMQQQQTHPASTQPEIWSMDQNDPSGGGGGDDGAVQDPGSAEHIAANLTSDAYLSEVDCFIEGGQFDMDDTLNAWYTAILEEIQGQRPLHDM